MLIILAASVVLYAVAIWGATGHSNSWGHGMALDFVRQVARAALARTTRPAAKGEG